MKKDIILFHGDFDGIASAALVIGLFRPASFAAIPCEPFGVNKALRRFEEMKRAGDAFERLFIVDLAPNNKCMSMTEKFMAACAAQFAAVELFDHHNGWENIEMPPGIEKHIDSSYKSCASLIYASRTERSGFFDTITSDADIIDSGGYEGICPQSAAVYGALKANLRDDDIKMKSLEFMLSGYRDAGCHEAVKLRATAYDEILARSLGAMSEKLVELTPRICYIDLGCGEYDITAIIMRCYERYPFVIVEYKSGGTIFDVVATRREDIDLVKVLGLKSGARFRVTITKRDRGEIVKAIETCLQ